MSDTTAPQNPGLTYADAGVDVEAGDRAVELMKSAVAATHGPQVVGGAGGFAGLFDVSALLNYRKPLLSTSTDGVGTKVAIAQAMDIHDTVGIDLVAMVVDDLVVSGSTPLFMTDYICCGSVKPERIAAIVRGIAEGCRLTGTALIGGETAEHPGLLGPDEYDIAGAATGVVEADQLLGPERVQPGDQIIAMASSGVHSNGFSLVRRIVAHAGWKLDQHVPEFGRTLGEELLTPTALYTKVCLALADDHACQVKTFSHITGGGIAANIARVLPAGTLATIDRSTWALPTVFRVLCEAGAVSQASADQTFNVGVGMVAVVDPAGVEPSLALLRAAGVSAWHVGGVATWAEHDRAAGDVHGTKGIEAGACRVVGEYAH